MVKVIMNYQEFLNSKIISIPECGIEVETEELHPSAKPHQIDTIKWALRLGRALGGLRFGLGKTHIQLEIARIITQKTGGKFLIICPLGNRHVFTDEDGKRLGIHVQPARSDEEISLSPHNIFITNYERVRDGHISPDHFVGVTLDEGSVLRSYDSKTYELFNKLFADTEFRYVFTATPDPNSYVELLNYGQFLGIMDTEQAITRWFKRDTTNFDNLTLHAHSEDEFWNWVASWALFLNKPSDLGYSDEGYDLPPLNIHYHCISADHKASWDKPDETGQISLLRISKGGLSSAAAEKRNSIDRRINKAVEIVQSHPGRHWLIWHHLENERKELQKKFPQATAVWGSQTPEEKEERLMAFSNGEIEILMTKPEIAGLGCNFQHHCRANVFVGITYKFEEFIQAIHRTYRFGQTGAVEVHVIYLDSEAEILNALKRKWAKYEEKQSKMSAIIRERGLSTSAIQQSVNRKMLVDRQEVRGEDWIAVNNDCVLELKSVPDNSVGLIHTSLPFSTTFEYSANFADFGHNVSHDAFFAQMDFLIPELYRVLKPGRIAAIHVKELVVPGHKSESGLMHIFRFPDKTAEAFEKHGFLYQGRVTITTDVVHENNKTYRLGYTEMTRDGSKMGVGLPEYILLFRKLPSDLSDARADEPVTKELDREGRNGGYSLPRWQIDAHGHWRSSGDRLVYAWENPVYDFNEHVTHLEQLARERSIVSAMAEEIGSCLDMVWTDVQYTNTLNTFQSRRRAENHVCPLPLDIVRRCIERWSNPGDLVLDPFGGLMTVPYVALEYGRRGMGIELNPVYFAHGARYLNDMEQKKKAPTLFDFLQVKSGQSKAMGVANGD